MRLLGQALVLLTMNFDLFNSSVRIVWLYIITSRLICDNLMAYFCCDLFGKVVYKKKCTDCLRGCGQYYKTFV